MWGVWDRVVANLTTCERTPWMLSRELSMRVDWLRLVGMLLAGRVSSPRRGVPINDRTSAGDNSGFPRRYPSFAKAHWSGY